MRIRDRLGDGKFWMWVWLVTFATAILWGVITVLVPPLRNSVFNTNLMSAVALILAGAGGVQATLGMRKADPDDPL